MRSLREIVWRSFREIVVRSLREIFGRSLKKRVWRSLREIVWRSLRKIVCQTSDGRKQRSISHLKGIIPYNQIGKIKEAPSGVQEQEKWTIGFFSGVELKALIEELF